MIHQLTGARSPCFRVDDQISPDARRCGVGVGRHRLGGLAGHRKRSGNCKVGRSVLGLATCSAAAVCSEQGLIGCCSNTLPSRFTGDVSHANRSTTGRYVAAGEQAEGRLERAERLNGRLAMVGFAIGVVTEALTGHS